MCVCVCARAHVCAYVCLNVFGYACMRFQRECEWEQCLCEGGRGRGDGIVMSGGGVVVRMGGMRHVAESGGEGNPGERRARVKARW